MITPPDLEAGVRSNLTLVRDSQAMISYKLFSHSEPLGPMIIEIAGLFDIMTPILFDINDVIWQP